MHAAGILCMQGIKYFFLWTVTAAQNTLLSGCYHYFVCILLIICLHLHLSLFLSIPSLQLHLSYSPTAPAVTLQRLCMVTMVTHHHHNHTGLLLSSPSLSSLPPLSLLRLRDLSQSSGPTLICIMWRMVLMLSENKLAEVHAWLKNDQQMWGSVIEKNGNVVTGKVRTCVCLCMWVCLVYSQEFFLSSWLPSLTDILFFLPPF